MGALPPARSAHLAGIACQVVPRLSKLALPCAPLWWAGHVTRAVRGVSMQDAGRLQDAPGEGASQVTAQSQRVLRALVLHTWLESAPTTAAA
jgi:hypothetical protein